MGGLMDAVNQGIQNGNNDGGGSGDSGYESGNTWGGGQQQGDPCEGNFYMSGYSVVCGCNSYTWDTSQNKCVNTGTTTSSGGEESGDGTVPGFQGFGTENQNTGSSNTNTGSGGSGYHGGVHTTPGEGSDCPPGKNTVLLGGGCI